LASNSLTDFKSYVPKATRDEFITTLALKYEDNTLKLFNGLNNDGIQSTLSTLVQRIAYNTRRQLKDTSERSSRKLSQLQQPFSSPSEALDQTRMEGAISLPATLKRQTNYTAARGSDLLDVNLKVRYNDSVTRLTLADIARLADPPLSLENVMLNITLPIFIKCLSEDLGLSTSLLPEVWFKYQGSRSVIRLLRDR